MKGFRVEREESTQRPILSAPQYEALLAKSSQVSSLFRLALIVTHETCHRIGAVSLFRWSDINFDGQEVHWRAENDKLKDRCALGGWKDHQTILTCYQRPDPATMKAALTSRMRLEA